MKVRVYFEGGLDTDILSIPRGADILDVIYEAYGSYLEYDIITG